MGWATGRSAEHNLAKFFVYFFSAIAYVVLFNLGFKGKMVRAWYMDDSTDDQRLEHHRNPPEFVDVKDLTSLTGVEYIKVSYYRI